MQKLFYLLVAACVLLMNTQYAIKTPAGYLGIVDVLIWATFALWVVSAIAGRSAFRPKLPPAAFFALPVLAVLLILRLRGADMTAAGKEAFQLVEYFIIAALLFISLGENETKLRGLIAVFLLAISAVMLWGLVDYMSSDDIFTAGGAYGNINVLGTYFGLALPFALGIALFDDIKAWQRISLVVTVAIGAAITLSGAALAATLAALLLVLAIRSTRLLPIGLGAVLLGVLVLPGILTPNHAKIVKNSVAVYLDNNYLLSADNLFDRAQALCAEGRYFDAQRLLLFIDSENKLSSEGEKLLNQIEGRLAGRERPESVLPHDRPVVAVRYKRWQAALGAIARNLWGYGPGKYQETVGQSYGRMHKFAYDTDELEAFNIGIDEPDTFNRFLVTTVELGVPGLLALLWVYLWALSRAVRLLGAARTGLGRGVAAGAAASLAFFPILAAYSDVLVRGVALPFVFIVCCVHVLEKQERESV